MSAAGTLLVQALVIAAAYAGAMSSISTDLFLAPCKGNSSSHVQSDETMSMRMFCASLHDALIETLHRGFMAHAVLLVVTPWMSHFVLWLNSHDSRVSIFC